jgi:glycosyltransferase involved in cell wall biosynthesis
VRKRSRIGIDCLSAVPGKAPGIWVVAKNLLEEITRLDAESQYFIFLNSLAAADCRLERPNVHLVKSIIGRSIGLRLGYQNVILPLLARFYGLDLLHSLGNYGPLCPLARSVVTVHDLIPFLNHPSGPERRLGLRAKTLDFLMEQSLRRAVRVAVDSDFTGRQLVARYPFVAPRIRVIYNGLPRRETPSESEIRSVLARYAVRRPYVLSVGLYFPHKNIGRLIQAFARLKQGRTIPHQLVLVGEPGANRANLHAAVAEGAVKDCVVFTGFVSDEEVAALYSAADMFVMPSLMEGFGFPVLEAMASKVPVVCANAGSLPEVAGDAAVLFDPTDVQDIARAIREVLQDDALRERRIAQGLKRVERFSFRRTAEETLDLYREVLG